MKDIIKFKELLRKLEKECYKLGDNIDEIEAELIKMYSEVE